MADITDKLLALGKQAVELRDKQELPWHEVAGKLDVATGKAMLAYEFAKVKPADRVKAENDKELAKAIVQLRKDGLSWGKISARTGQGESKCRSLFESIKGEGSTSGNRIGKGGRHPGGTSKKVAKKVVAKKTVAKKAAAVKKTAGRAPAAKKAVAKKTAAVKKSAKSGSPGGASAPGSHPLAGLDYDALAERLEGRAITVVREGRRDEHIKVRSVKSLDDGVVELLDEDRKTRNIRVTEIRALSKG